MKNRSWLVVALVVAGCGADVDPVVPPSRPPDAAVPVPVDAAAPADAATSAPADAASELRHSGTRMRQLIGSTPDGAREWYGWFDQQLGLRCDFTEATDGKIRCLPHEHANVLDGYFTDDACSRPLAIDTNHCALVYGFSWESAAGNTCTWQKTKVWALTPHSGTAYHRDTDGHCAAVASFPAEYSLFSATELPLSTFQEMTVSIE